MEYRLNKQKLLETLAQWNGFLRRKVCLIACGGTALTLLDIKSSTKDVDFMVPNSAEHKYLTKTLQDLGYLRGTGSGWYRPGELFVFDLFSGNNIHTTQLLDSPLLEENHMLLQEFSRLYVGILNYNDLIASKLFRATPVDFEDCLALVRTRREEIDLERLTHHYLEMASYDVSEKRLIVNLEDFLTRLREEGLYG